MSIESQQIQESSLVALSRENAELRAELERMKALVEAAQSVIEDAAHVGLTMHSVNLLQERARKWLARDNAIRALGEKP